MTSAEMAGSGHITGGIWLEINHDRHFPMSNWDDFVVLIVNQWIQAAIDGLTTPLSQAKVHFMDGPFEVGVVGTGKSGWSVNLVTRRKSGEELESFQASPQLLIASILDAGEAVLRGCLERRWGDVGEVQSLALLHSRLGLMLPAPNA